MVKGGIAEAIGKAPWSQNTMHLEFITKRARRPARKGKMQVYCNLQENAQERGYEDFRVRQSREFPGNGKGRLSIEL